MLMNCAAYQKGRKLADVAIDNLTAYRDVPDAFIYYHDQFRWLRAARERRSRPPFRA